MKDNIRGWGLSAAAFLAAAVLLAASPCAAQRVPIEYKVEAGFSGIAGQRSGIIPVTVTLRNTVISTTGSIEISCRDSSGNYEVRQVLPFSLPAPSTKRFSLLVRVEPFRDPTVTVGFKDGITPIMSPLNVRRVDTPIVLCVNVPSNWKAGEAKKKYTFADIGRDTVPADPLAMDAVHALMISGQAFSDLDPTRIEAVAQWVATGGILILFEPVGGAPFAQNCRALGLRPGGNVMSRGIYPCGSGLVASSGTQASEDSAFWEGNTAQSVTLFPALAFKDTQSINYGGRDTFAGLWRTRRSYGVIGFLSIILIIVAYIGVIGPLDWWVTKRLGRPYLTWIFFAGAVVLFSAIAYGYSTFINVDVMRSVQVNIIDAAPGQRIARGNSFYWVCSARNATYTITTPVQNVFLSARENMMSTPGNMAGVDVVNGRNSQMSARIPIFSSKTFDAAWYMPWVHEVKAAGDGSGSIVVPPELKVQSAFLAQSEGLSPMLPKGNTLIPGKRQPWKEALQQHSVGGGMYYYGGRNELMPKDDVLRNYLIGVSFPWAATAALETASQNPNQAAANPVYMHASGREASLDVACRLRAGKVLLLFLEPSGNMLPMSISQSSPRSVCANLVRIQLPFE